MKPWNLTFQRTVLLPKNNQEEGSIDRPTINKDSPEMNRKWEREERKKKKQRNQERKGKERKGKEKDFIYLESEIRKGMSSYFHVHVLD